VTAADRAVQRPADARLLVVDAQGRMTHTPRSRFVDFLQPGDLVIANDAATLPASLRAVHLRSGADIEVRLAARSSLAANDVHRFSAVIFGAGDFRTRTEDRPLPPSLAPGDRLVFAPALSQAERPALSEVEGLWACVEALLCHARLVRLQFEGSPSTVWEGLARHGRPIQYAHMTAPLALWDVWTPIAGLPAAFEPPSASFALDWESLRAMRDRGVAFATITLAAGISSTGDPALDCRLPLDEPYRISDAAASAIGQARAAGGRIVAIGTTVVRALEHAAARDSLGLAGEGVANQRIGAASRLRIVDAILSGTHEPDSSHYQLLRAFVDDAVLSQASAALEANGYRTHEFGDSVLIEKNDRCADDNASAGGLPHRKRVLGREGKAWDEPAGTFEVQERFLPPQQPAVAAELSVLVDHAVAGNDNRDAVQAVCVSDCALRAGRADRAGEIVVRPRLSERDPLKLGPHALLERRAGRRERQRKRPQLSGKIGVQLVAQPIEMGRLAGNDGTVESSANRLDLRRQHTAVGELQ
jgi:S-adenosylmethionine:tRNA ribosyltransferase-isomerase